MLSNNIVWPHLRTTFRNHNQRKYVQFEKLKYWRYFEDVHKKWDFCFLLEKCHLCWTSPSCVQLSIWSRVRVQKSKSDRKKKQTHTSIQEMQNIHTFTENGFFPSFSTIQYCISWKLYSESTTLDLESPVRYYANFYFM